MASCTSGDPLTSPGPFGMVQIFQKMTLLKHSSSHSQSTFWGGAFWVLDTPTGNHLPTARFGGVIRDHRTISEMGHLPHSFKQLWLTCRFSIESLALHAFIYKTKTRRGNQKKQPWYKGKQHSDTCFHSVFFGTWDCLVLHFFQSQIPPRLEDINPTLEDHSSWYPLVN